ncbi:MscL family protein [Streptomyces sp. NPDC002889]
MNGFRSFILRGNVVDLAVYIVIGAAFTAVVTASCGPSYPAGRMGERTR